MARTKSQGKHSERRKASDDGDGRDPCRSFPALSIVAQAFGAGLSPRTRASRGSATRITGEPRDEGAARSARCRA